MPSSTATQKSSKTFHTESRTTTSYHKSSSVTTTYSKKVTTRKALHSRSSTSLHLDIKSTQNGKEFGAAVGKTSSSVVYRRTSTERSGNSKVTFGDSQVTWGSPVDEPSTTVHVSSPKKSELDAHELPVPVIVDEETTIVVKNDDPKGDIPTTVGKGAEKYEEFKQEQIRRFREGHLKTLVGPKKGLKMWEVKKLPVPKCRDGHSPNWFAYGANVYALDNVHRRGYLPNVYGPPEHHLEAGEIVYEIDRTVDNAAVWIKHKFWSRATKRWRTGWTKACWMNRIKPDGILHMSQSYQG